MKHGQKIVLRGEAGTNDKTLLPGDIVFVLEQKENNTGFERINMDLIYEMKITLWEALGGSKFFITHLDKRVLEFSTAPGDVIKPDSWFCINDEGMPVHQQPFNKGNLYVQFKVAFPDSLNE